MLKCKLCDLSLESRSRLIIHYAKHQEPEETSLNAESEAILIDAVPGANEENGLGSKEIEAKKGTIVAESTADENSDDSESDPFGYARLDDSDKDPDWLPSDEDSSEIDQMSRSRKPTTTHVNIPAEPCMPAGNSSSNNGHLTVLEKPNVKKRSRWNRADPSTWTRNIAKKLRKTGQAYESKYGKFEARKPKPVNCKCKFKCRESFTEEDRAIICSEYWALGDYVRQKDFLLKHSRSTIPKCRRSRKGGKERTNAKQFFFMKNGMQNRVCRLFFLNTLCISNGPLNVAYQRASASGTFISGDMRGKHQPANKLTSQEIEKIKQHIEKFPVVESHYVRKSSQRKYLDRNLSISKMYSLYQEECKERNEKVPSLTTYKRIFCREYNYSFFKPKKDQCSICTRFEAAQGTEKEALQSEYLEHRKREKEANESKAADKAKASEDPNFVTATFDLQSVLQIPSSDVSPMYYSRKLCAYNLTVYEGAPPNNAHCYTWHEINGKRGSIEIGTCLYQFLTSLPKNVTEVSLFSDTCGGQNRNQNVVALLMFVVQTTHISVIEQKFLESGHSMMECDSMHSAIEHQKRFVSVYTMHDWLNIFSSARSARRRKNANPYTVKQLQFGDFIDLTSLSSSIMCNKTKDSDGNKVNWLKVKCFRFEKDSPGIVKYRYDHYGKYSEINIFGRGRPKKMPTLQKAYTNSFPISEKKYKDLVSLCNKGVIPKEFHAWYHSLPHSGAVKDRNPEPSVDSDSECEANGNE